MSEKAKETAQEIVPNTALPDPEELVEYSAPVDVTGQEDDIIAGVNGEIIRIKRGETVQIKRKFLEVIENANRQMLETMELRKKTIRAGKKPLFDR